MAQLSPTRSALLARRAQLDLAEQGRDLLRDKRSALIKEFNRLSASITETLAGVERRAVEARRALAAASAGDGPEAVGSAALAASGRIELELKTSDVAGVPLVEVRKQPVSRAPTGRGYSLAGTSARIDHAAERFEEVLDALLETAAKEAGLRRLAAEIEKTTRRVNGLEQVVVPRIERERDYIAVVLEDREREDRVRLMRAKGR